MAKPFECVGFQACVPAVDTGTQYWLPFLGPETSHPDQCPAVDAGIAPQVQSRASRSAGSQRHVQVTQHRLAMSLDHGSSATSGHQEASDRAAQECRPMD